MNIITGYRNEPHITAQQDRDFNIGVVGNSETDAYVFDVGQNLHADVASANEIRIRDGIVCFQGCTASIDYGAYDSLAIDNGAQGYQRIDVIAVQYTKDSNTNIESMELVVVKGTQSASTPSAPTLITGNIQAGAAIAQAPLYYVNIDGVSIDSVEAKYISTPGFDGLPTAAKTGSYRDLTNKPTLSPMFKVVSVNHSFTIPANGYQSVAFAPTAQTGYSRVGIVGYNTGSTHAFIATCTGTTIVFGNKNNAQVSCNGQIDWLFIRSTF